MPDRADDFAQVRFSTDDLPENERLSRWREEFERGLMRAFMNNIGRSGRPEGGSTITQQLVKNLLVGDDRTYDRKIREMIMTARVESLLTKD